MKGKGQMKKFGSVKTSAMHSGGVSILRGFIYLIIALISFYGDGVFVWMNIGHYTGSYAVIFQIFLVLGAFCTSASIMALLFGKAYWFRPGAQLWIAYIFTAVEVAVNVLNIVIALNPNLGIVELWRIFSPATPFVALIGWIFILQVDKSQRERHAQMEMQEQKNDAEREYEMMVHQANMDLKFGYLDQTKQRLQAALNSPMAQQIVEQHAQNLTAQVLNEITGLPVMQQHLSPAQPKTAQFNNDSYVKSVCVADGTPSAGMYRGNPYCQDCLDKIANNVSRPMMTGADFVREFDEWQEQQKRPLETAPLEIQDSQPGTNGKH
jgi:hypothetical protein